MKTFLTAYGFLASLGTRRRRARGGLAGLGILLGGALASAAHAQAGFGDLLVAPTRIVFAGRQRTAEITVVNTGTETATYRISFIDLRMNEEGGTTEIQPSGAAPGERFAAPLVRYSPQQITLVPRMAQTVRMQLRLPPDLEAGEYRSHLLFRAVPTAPAEPTTAPATDFSIQLTPVYGISIPVIVRHGETSASATLAELQLVPPAGAETAPTLRFSIRRTGNQSVYGNLTVTFVPAVGKPSVVGMANGVAVYAPNALRRVGIALHPPPGVILEHGRLHLTYSAAERGSEAIAEADLLVP